MLKVTISKKWNEPKITCVITKEDHSYSIGMEDFVEAFKQEINLDNFVVALKAEIGSVRYVVKQDTFESRLDAAFDSAKQVALSPIIDAAIKRVILGVQEESIKVITKRE